MIPKPDSLKNRNTYIPASVQKSMAQHIEHTMPGHLKKFQQGGYIPKHAEKAISQHMQKSLPSHLKQYADPYLQQNIMRGNNLTSSVTPKASSYRPTVSRPGSMFNKQNFSSGSSQQIVGKYTTPAVNSQASQEQQPQGSGNNYDFIMNPQNSGNKSTFLAPQSTKMRILIFGGGIILLIILMSVFFSFLNAAGNKQKENLLEVAKTQQEIIRVIDSSKEFISARDLDDKVKTLRAVIVTSQQETTAALAAKGKEVNPKELAKSQNPQNDADLESARAQARGDEALNDILLNLLGQYAAQLQKVFDAGNESEKALATDAFNQVNLIYSLSNDASSEDPQGQATQ